MSFFTANSAAAPSARYAKSSPWPGLAAAIAGSIAAFWLGKTVPAFNDVAIGILLGLLIRNLVPEPLNQRLSTGFDYCLDTVLRTAIILLGLGLNLQQIASSGLSNLLIIALVVVLAIPLVRYLAARLGVSRDMALLLGVGSAICGSTAIMATGSMIQAEKRDMALAVATIFIFNTLSLFFYPVIGLWAGLTDLRYGTWVGMSVQDVSSVAAVGFAYSQAAGQVAIVVKLTRTLFIVPTLFVMSWLVIGRDGAAAGRKSLPNIMKVFPWFILGFLIVVILNSLGIFPELVRSSGQTLSRFLLLMAMVAVGYSVSLGKSRGVSHNYLWAGLAGMAIMAATSFLLIILAL